MGKILSIPHVTLSEAKRPGDDNAHRDASLRSAWHCMRSTWNPKPETWNPKPETWNPKP